MSSPRNRLQAIVTKLAKFHGPIPVLPKPDPYLILLWEQVAYLADDATRLTAYRMLEKLVGVAPDEILTAPLATLRKIARAGGPIAVETRALRLQKVAGRVADHWGGNLAPVLKLPFEDARRELMKYPTIGKPGAERILLLCGAYTALGIDSNAMRVLLRLGYGAETGRYDKTYDSVQAAAQRELPDTVKARRTALLVLRAHGQTLCRRSRPECGRCPVRDDCPTGLVTMNARSTSQRKPTS